MNYSESFDTHDFIKQLIDKKFIPEQAEAIVSLLMEFKRKDHKALVKKDDLYRELIFIKNELHKMELRMICQQFSGQNFTQFFVYFRIPLVINNHW